MKKIIAGLIGVIAGLTSVISTATAADRFTVAIMQDQAGAAQKLSPLIDYLAKRGVAVSFRTTQNYLSAAQLFASGNVDAMFSGSGVAGTLMIKGLADPLVRPVDKDGESTYKAYIISRKGAPKFNGNADYFNGKKVALTALASSGEFYFKSLPDANKTTAKIVKSSSHGSAIEAVEKGYADVAIVKNHVWEKQSPNFPNLVLVGEDNGQNPDGTLMVSKKLSPEIAAKVAAALLEVKSDSSAEAAAVKKGVAIQGYVKTTPKDFEHTLKLLKSAGVTKSFEFN